MNKGPQDDDLPIETLGESMSRMQDSQALSPARRQRPTLEQAPPRLPRMVCAVLLAGVLGLVTWETGAAIMQHMEAAGDDD